MNEKSQSPAAPMTADRLTDRELQSLRNMGGLAEQAADEIATSRSQCAAEAHAPGWRKTAETLFAFLEGVKDVGCVTQYEDGSDTPNKHLMNRLHGELADLLAGKPQPKGMPASVVEVTFDLDLGTPSVKVVQGEFERGRTYRFSLQGVQAPAPAPEALEALAYLKDEIKKLDALLSAGDDSAALAGIRALSLAAGLPDRFIAPTQAPAVVHRIVWKHGDPETGDPGVMGIASDDGSTEWLDDGSKA